MRQPERPNLLPSDDKVVFDRPLLRETKSKKWLFWMPLDIGDHLATTGHLSAEQHGVYLLLQMHYWTTGNLPADDRSLANIARVSERKWKGMRKVILAYFNGDGSAHPLLDEQLAKAERISMQRRISGAKGGFNSAVVRRRDEMLDRGNRLAFATPNANGFASANGVSSLQLTDTQSQPHTETANSSSLATKPHSAWLPPTKRPSETSRAELDKIYSQKHRS